MQRINSKSTDEPSHSISGEFAANINWLQTHWQEYNDRWVVLNNGTLLLSGDEFQDIQPYALNHPTYKNIMWVHVGHDYIAHKE